LRLTNPQKELTPWAPADLDQIGVTSKKKKKKLGWTRAADRAGYNSQKGQAAGNDEKKRGKKESYEEELVVGPYFEGG